MIDFLKVVLDKDHVTLRAVATDVVDGQKYYGVTLKHRTGHLYFSHFGASEEKGVVYGANYHGFWFLEFQLQGKQTIHEMDVFLKPHIEAAKGQGLKEHQEAIRKANEPIKRNPHPLC